METKTSISIVIISYNTRLLTLKCLTSVFDSLAKLPYSSEVIVVDNASTDDSVSEIHSHFPSVKILLQSKNSGFSKGNNEGIKESYGKYVLFLNSDAFLNAPALSAMVAFLDSHPNAAVVGPHLVNQNKSIQYSVGYEPNLARIITWMFFLDDMPILKRILSSYHQNDPWFYKKNHPVDWVSGACLMFRKKILNTVGYLDEKIFMYGEEVEWCSRIRKSGVEVWYVKTEPIVHLQGASAVENEGAAGIEQEFKFLTYWYQMVRSKQVWALKMIIKAGIFLRFVIFGIIRAYPQRRSLYAKILGFS